MNNGDAYNDTPTRMADEELDPNYDAKGTRTDWEGYDNALERLQYCAMLSSPEFADAVNSCFEEPVYEPVDRDALVEAVSSALSKASLVDQAQGETEALKAQLAEAQAELAKLKAKAGDTSDKPKNKGGRPPKNEGLSGPAMVEALTKHFMGQVKNLKHVKVEVLKGIYDEFQLGTGTPKAPSVADVARVSEMTREARKASTPSKA